MLAGIRGGRPWGFWCRSLCIVSGMANVNFLGLINRALIRACRSGEFDNKSAWELAYTRQREWKTMFDKLQEEEVERWIELDPL